MLYNAIGDYRYDEAITVAYKLNNGRTVTRYYSQSLLALANDFDYEPYDYTDDIYDESYGYSYSETDFSGIYTKAMSIFSSKQYILKYSGVANADLNADYNVKSVIVHGMFNFSDDSTNSASIDNYSGYELDEEKKTPRLMQ